MSIIASGATINTMNTITVTGNVSHGGLSFSTGTDIDQQILVPITTAVTAGTYYIITNGSNHLTSTGTYLGKVFINTQSGGDLWDETFTFLFSWSTVGTNENSQNNAVFTHNMGHAKNGRTVTLRTRRRTSGTGGSAGVILEFTLSHNQNSYTYNWYFRRVL